MITSPANERIKYVRSLQEVRVRRRERAFVVEGVRLVEEALRAGVTPSLVLVDDETLERTPRGRALLGQLRPFAPMHATEQALKAAAGTVTPQGVVAVVPLPDQPLTARERQPVTLVLEEVSDPGNVGTILRTAWAAGIVDAVVALGGADFYNPKVVRAAAGAHFHLSLVEAPDWGAVGAQAPGRRVLAAVAHSGEPYHVIDWRVPTTLVVGSEAHGVRPEIVSAADGLVCIPMPGTAESLNAAIATGILIFEAARQIIEARTGHTGSQHGRASAK